MPAPGPSGSWIPRREKRACGETVLSSSPVPRRGHFFVSSVALSAISLLFPKRNTVTFPFPPCPLRSRVLRNGAMPAGKG